MSFYWDYCCGGLCGYGSLAFYKKEGGIWKQYMVLFDWTS